VKDSSEGVVRQRRHRHRRMHGKTKFLVVLLFAAAAAITWQFARQQPVSSLSYSYPGLTPVGLDDADKSWLANQSDSFYIASRPSRPAYLYSVIPGGVASVEELRHAVERDPVAAQHFAGFDFQRAHLVQVSEKQSMHVAYRVGDKVYWTRKKVSLRPGETLISDGKIVARTRCGNRVAMAPMGPPAMLDPLESDLDRPLFSNDMVTNEVVPQADPYVAQSALPEAAKALKPTNGRKKILPFFLLPLFGVAGGSSSHTPPLTPTPEPGTILLLSSGLAGVYWRARKSRRKQ
jgi:hypothetical protein